MMYTVGLFSIAAVGLTSIQSVAINAGRRATNISLAANLASSCLEELRLTALPGASLMNYSAWRCFDLLGVEKTSSAATGCATYFSVQLTIAPPTTGGGLVATAITRWPYFSNTPSRTTYVHEIGFRTRYVEAAP